MNMVENILSETESSLDRQWRDMEFCYEVMEQHREMEKFINESLIIASGNKKAINEMYILNEATLGDKIKSFFEKIKNFFKKIFDKFGASLNGVFMEQKKYIDRYAFIITKCKWQNGDISDIKDRFKGLPRIIDAVDNTESAIIGNNMDQYFKGDKPSDDNFIDVNVFKSADSIENAYKDEKFRTKIEAGATRDDVYNKFVGTGYWSNVQDFGSFKESDSNGNVDVNATFAAWFDGSKDTVSYSSDEVDKNFQTIINTVYAGQSYLTKLEKIVASVTKKMDEAAKNMEDYHKSQQQKIMQAVKQSGSTTSQNNDNEATKNKEQEEEQKAAEKVKQAQNAGNKNNKPEMDSLDTSQIDQEQQKADQEKAKADLGIKPLGGESAIIKFINEMNFNNKSSSSDENKNTKGPTGAGNTQINNASKSNENISKVQANKMNAKDVNNTTGVDNNNKNDIEKKANEILDTDIYNRQLKINESINISSTIVRKMFASFKDTNNDFFTIIKAHVQWYLANPGAEKAAENQTTRSRSLEMNANGNNVNKTTNTNNNNGNASA